MRRKLRRISIKFALPRLSRTVLVGALASLCDFCVLMILVRLLGWTPQGANVPSLMVGATIQFFGNRHYVFKARDGHIGKQFIGFILAEITSLCMNAGAFYVLITWTPINFALARPLGTFLVFAFFSYPAWGLIFKQKRKPNSTV